MPNWCNSTLCVKGLKASVDSFLELIRSEVTLFDFCRIVPETSVNQEQGGKNWHVENWGTKTNAYLACVEHDRQWEHDGKTFAQASIRFRTAWTAPGHVVRRAAEMFPELSFDLFYFEPVAGFDGRLSFERGEVICDECQKPNLGFRG